MDSYYHSHDLGKFADMGKGNQELWDKFMGYYSAVFAEGALTEREKALIALAVAHMGRSFIRKAATAPEKHRRTIIWYGLSIVLVLAAIPWPFMSAGRPLFRFFGL